MTESRGRGRPTSKGLIREAEPWMNCGSEQVTAGKLYKSGDSQVQERQDGSVFRISGDQQGGPRERQREKTELDPVDPEGFWILFWVDKKPLVYVKLFLFQKGDFWRHVENTLKRIKDASQESS